MRSRDPKLAALLTLLLLFTQIFAQGPVEALHQPMVNVCAAPPALDTPENQFTPKPGVTINTWKFDAGVTQNGWEDTRISVAASSLNLFDWKLARTLIPGFLNPHQSVIDNDAAVAINSDFFDLWSSPFPWGPAINDGEVEYFPHAYDPTNGYTTDWLKVVGVISKLPNPATGWTTTGQVQIAANPLTISGLNLPALPLNGIVVYDSRREGKTPVGEVSLLIQGNHIIDFSSTGRGYTLIDDQIAVQAQGKAATNLLSKFTGREVEVNFGNPESVGYRTKSSLLAGGTSSAISAVNLASNKTALFTSLWNGVTPKKSLTWIIQAGKIKQIFPKGMEVAVGSGQKVIQFGKPSAAIKKLKIGTKVKFKITKPTVKQGYLTAGNLRIGGLDFPIGGINKNAGASTISLYTKAYEGKSPAGALTLNIANGVITSLDLSGQPEAAGVNEYILQVPAAIAANVSAAFISPETTVTVDETSERIKTISDTKMRYRATLAANGEKVVFSAMNYFRIDATLGTVYDDNWIGPNSDAESYAGSASIRVRNGVIQKINVDGAALKIVEPGDLVFQLGWLQASTVQDWQVGMPAIFKSKYQTKDDQKYETVTGFGTKLINDSQIVSDCATTGEGIRPRTALGWNDSGQYWLMTASPASRDPNNSGYRTGGANYEQVARWLKSLGASHAVGLDGGGSTWMIRRTTSGATRVDMPEPNNCTAGDTNMGCDPWIRAVPFVLMLVPAAE
mgnify:CR=1 FL=1